MNRLAILPMFLLLTSAILLLPSPSAGQQPVQKAILLNVGQGQVPGDTGMDDKTVPATVEGIPELPGKAMKVPFARGDSFGGKVGASSKNWKRFAVLRFDAVNPST